MVKLKPPVSKSGNARTTANTTLADLKQDPILWYKIYVLLYDLCHISSDRAAEARMLRTTDELYISSPYFTTSEAALIKATTTEVTDAAAHADDSEFTAVASPMTVEQAIQTRLAGFLDKRRASGDARPCGPHDLAPVYKSVFGIAHGELQDEQFLARLRRSGLGDSAEKEEGKGSAKKDKMRKKGR